MGYFTAKQFSEKWKISERRIIKLCSDDRISGAIKNGMVWLIPEETIKPSDKRSSIAKYINTQKRVYLISDNKEISDYLCNLLKKEGYIIDNNLDSKYYSGLIIIDLENKLANKEKMIKEISKKMNCESSIVLVEPSSAKSGLEGKLAKELKENIGLRINSLNIDVNLQKDILINNEEISEDIKELLVGFKNTTGMNVITDGGSLKFNQNGRTDYLKVGDFYSAITGYFKRMNEKSYMWCASTMMEDEWTEEPLEMAFRVVNLEAANRGANIERIFIFSKSKIKEFKNNKTLKIYMQSQIKTMFVDYDEIKEKEPELLDVVSDGWDGIDQDLLLVDLPTGSKERGYISKNKEEVKKAYKCFEKLKKYAKDLKEVLK